MYRKITTGKAKTAERIIITFEDDLDRKRHNAIATRDRDAFRRCLEAPGFRGEVGDVAVADDLIVLGLGARESIGTDAVRRAGAKLHAFLDRAGITAVVFTQRSDCDGLAVDSLSEALAEGIALANWRLEGYDGTSGKSVTRHARLRLDAERPASRAGFKRGLALAEAVNLTRMVSTTPPNVCHPAWVAKQARRLARDSGMSCKVIDAKKAESLGMGGITNVGKASEIPPCLVQLEWKPPKVAKAAKGRHLVLVGKTITYDTGGYSLKISNSMRGMKYDMCGGAAVLGAMKAIADSKLPVRVTGLLPAAENMVADDAYRPDDIITMYDGTTVEVTNTDAEGRLVLGDALAYACDRLKPTEIVDIATLTGGVVVALGNFCAGMWCEHDRFRGAIECAATGSDEKVWQMPVWDAHREFMRSPVADILNSNPKRLAPPIQGAAFLSYFVDPEIPWAHLDIAGVASVESDPVTGAGSTGWGVRLLHTLVRGMAT